MFPIVVATKSHARIHQNLSGILYIQLQDRPCEAAIGDLGVRIETKGPYFYPDIVVFCGTTEAASAGLEFITDPKVIIEVLSPSTSDYDRGFKFMQYRRLPSFTDYIVVAQDAIYLEHDTRQPDGSWNLREVSDPEVIIRLTSVECSFRVGDAYKRGYFLRKNRLP
jgi:Uma2 family endonuclease